MDVVYAPRASTILYNILVSRGDNRPFILPANICPIVPITFLKAGTPYTFVDISAEGYHIDLALVEQHIHQGEIGGFLYSHTYGDESTPNDFFRFIRNIDENILIIDDRCLCLPDTSLSSPSFADVIIYSTGYSKIVDIGFGGYAKISPEITFKNIRLAYREDDLKAIETEYKKSSSSRSAYIYQDCDWLETESENRDWAMYFHQIEAALVDSLKHRKMINEIYISLLPTEYCLPPGYQRWRFNLLVPARDELLKAIFDEGLFASSHYASLGGIMGPGNCPVAEDLASQVVNLFNDFHFTEDMARNICAIILDVLGEG